MREIAATGRGAHQVTAIGYLRVSTADQAREGWSLPAQRRRMRAYCEGRDWQLDEIFYDETSGKAAAARAGFDRMLGMALAGGIDAVVAMKLDRIGRSARGLLELYEDLEAKGVAIATIEDGIDTSTPQGRLFRTILAGVAEFERDMISERTRVGLAEAHAQGKRLGRPPYGWIAQAGQLVEHEDEQRIIALMREFQDDGFGYRRIASELNARGIHARRMRSRGDLAGRRWHPSTVYRALSGSQAPAPASRLFDPRALSGAPLTLQAGREV